MDLIVIPQALLIFFGALVLGCGSVLGVVLGRNVRKRMSEPEPPDRLGRRIDILERELEDTRSDLRRLRDETAFLRELRAPPQHPEDSGTGRRRIVA